MGKIKGLVLKSTPEKTTLLTDGGEYRCLPSRGRIYPVGAEVEMPLFLLSPQLPFLAAAALLLLAVAFTLLWQAAPRPRAYLALDINPSILLLLDEEGAVLNAEPLNAEAEALDSRLELKGLPATAAIAMILKEARTQGYLSAEGENMIFLSLAAPPGYALNEVLLKETAAAQLFNLEVDAYLKTGSATLEAAQQARQKKISLNALLLAEELGNPEILSLLEKGKRPTVPAEEKKGLVVRDLVEKIPPRKIFQEKEFIPGNPAAKKSNAPLPPPGFSPPGQDRNAGPPAFTPPDWENKEEPPALTPPGQKKGPGPPGFSPPGRRHKQDS